MYTAFNRALAVRASLLFLIGIDSAVWATIVTIQNVVDTQQCGDSIGIGPTVVDELGVGFPLDELIFASDGLSPVGGPCVGINPVLIEITNTVSPPRSFTNLWYVGDTDTFFLNTDGTIEGGLAMKIDAVGVHQPLLFESIVSDGIFAPNETWTFASRITLTRTACQPVH